jgi:hypothetical protein
MGEGFTPMTRRGSWFHGNPRGSWVCVEGMRAFGTCVCACACELSAFGEWDICVCAPVSICACLYEYVCVCACAWGGFACVRAVCCLDSTKHAPMHCTHTPYVRARMCGGWAGACGCDGAYRALMGSCSTKVDPEPTCPRVGGHRDDAVPASANPSRFPSPSS